MTPTSFPPMSQPESGSSAPRLMRPIRRERWIEVVRIVATGLAALLFWQALVPIQLRWMALAPAMVKLFGRKPIENLVEQSGSEAY